MAATISSTGTFSTITGLDVTKSNATGNHPNAIGLNFESLKNAEGVQFDELRQFIQLVATAYGLSFWPAAGLVSFFLRALFASGELTLADSSDGKTRLFTP